MKLLWRAEILPRRSSGLLPGRIASLNGTQVRVNHLSGCVPPSALSSTTVFLEEQERLALSFSVENRGRNGKLTVTSIRAGLPRSFEGRVARDLRFTYDYTSSSGVQSKDTYDPTDPVKVGGLRALRLLASSGGAHDHLTVPVNQSPLLCNVSSIASGGRAELTVMVTSNPSCHLQNTGQPPEVVGKDEAPHLEHKALEGRGMYALGE